jgi:regulatory protein RepA
MTAYDIIKKQLQDGMVQGEMHACLRDTGRLAGGYAAGGAITPLDLHHLRELAESLAINPREAVKKWDEAVVYGRNEPLRWEQQRDEGRALDWSDSIGGGGYDDHRIVDAHWVQDAEISEPVADWNPVGDLTKYLSTLFDAEDQVGYVTEAWHNEESQRWLPKKGAYDRTAGALIDALNKCGGDIGSVLGDYNPQVGAWIRFNPLDGTGVRDENVTKFRYALVESDVVEIPRQMALITELELPVAALVHSGGKSLHAIVRIDADSMTEYRARVDYLFEVCKKNGLEMDRQNRNPSRLSRMPGVLRNGHKQWLVATNIGKPSWGEWKEWVEDLKDDLPDIVDLDISDKEPELAPVLIDGVLREGHKMLLSGPSKAGKSFALIQLAIAFAEGGMWFGWRVRQGRVLYVNLELDERSGRHRFWKIYQTLGGARSRGMIDVWNLRGNSTSLDKLAPKLIRRAGKKGYGAVIIDPIYKVLTGDENSAEQMALFCNQFDRICKQLGAATIYCHHHSKGAQGHKSSRDRSSGSGVFARDPDAILDMIELAITEGCRKQVVNRWQCDAMHRVLSARNPSWDLQCDQDTAIVADKLAAWAGDVPGLAEAMTGAAGAAMIASAWRIETTLREFPAAGAQRVWFRYPVHVLDGGDLLKDAKAEGEEPPWQKMQKQRSERNQQKKSNANETFFNAVEALKNEAGMVKVKDVAEYVGVSEDAVEKRARKIKSVTLDGGWITVAKEAQQ